MNQLKDQSSLKLTLDVLDEIRDDVRGATGDSGAVCWQE